MTQRVRSCTVPSENVPLAPKVDGAQVTIVSGACRAMSWSVASVTFTGTLAWTRSTRATRRAVPGACARSVPRWSGALVTIATLGAFAVPSLLGIALRLVYRSADLAVAGMTAFVVVAAATCLFVALATDGARTVLDGAYRASRTRGPSAPEGSLPAGLSLGAFLGDLCAPATYLFASAAAAAALLIAPMLARL